MKQFKYCFILPPFLSNFAEFDARKLTILVPNFAVLDFIWPFESQFSASNSVQLESRGIENRNSIELPHVLTERLCV